MSDDVEHPHLDPIIRLARSIGRCVSTGRVTMLLPHSLSVTCMLIFAQPAERVEKWTIMQAEIGSLWPDMYGLCAHNITLTNGGRIKCYYVEDQNWWEHWLHSPGRIPVIIIITVVFISHQDCAHCWRAPLNLATMNCPLC